MTKIDFAGLAALVTAIACIPADHLWPVVAAVVVLLVVAR